MEFTKINKTKLEFIDMKVNQFINDFHIEIWPIDCVQLILKIQKEKKVKIHIQSTLDLPPELDAKTICMDSSYYIFVNKHKIHYPYKRSEDRRLNFTIAHEIGHIYSNHFDLPNEVKPAWLIALEDKEAHEFAGRLLMPERILKNRDCKCTEILAKNFIVSKGALSTRLSNLEMV